MPKTVLLLVLLLCGDALAADGLVAGDEGSLDWSSSIGGSHAAAMPGDGFEAEIYRACGTRSLALETVAASLAARRAARRRPPDARVLATLVQAAGVAQPWPRAWSVVANDAQAKRRFLAWLRVGRGDRRCGFGRAIDARGRGVVAAVTVDALAELSPLPRRVRVSSWVALDARISAGAGEAAVVLLGPDGVPKRVYASLVDGVVRSRFNLDRGGEWLVQVVATLPSGPEPVLEARFFAGQQSDEQSEELAADTNRHPNPPAEAGREGKMPPRLGDVQVLMRWLMAERRERGLPVLKRSEELDRLASAHAQAMANKGEAVHDAGDGGPVERVRAAGIRAGVVGENVARAHSAEAAHRALWDSPSHRANMLSRGFRRIGVGAARSGAVWVVELFSD